MQLELSNDKYGFKKYYLSIQDGHTNSKVSGLVRFDKYFPQSNISENPRKQLSEYITENGLEDLQKYIHHLFTKESVTYFGHITESEYEKEQKKKKRARGRGI